MNLNIQKVKIYARRSVLLFIIISLFTISCFADSDGDVPLSLDISDEAVSTVGLPDVSVNNSLGLSESPSASVLRISASDTSGLHAIVLSLIGDYNPIVVDHVYSQSGSYTSHHVEVEPDWSWIASCAIFALVLYSFFRILGSLFSK